jgi:hypothetical protein
MNANALTLWDTIKCVVTGETIKYSSLKKRNRIKQVKNLQESLAKLQDELHNGPSSDDTLTEINRIKKDIEEIISIDTKGSIMRSKIQWYEEGEKSSKYFLNLEKLNYNSKNIKRIENDNGEVLTDNNDILNCEVEFYKSLYKSLNLENNEMEYADLIYNNLDNIPKLSEDEKKDLDTEITEAEILAALKTCKNGKSPGIDGIPVEFYKVFWLDIKKVYVESIKYSILTQSLSISQRRGIISLIPKKDKNILILKNWRPLSLLTADYKILAKCLALRLKKCIQKLIYCDQTGFLKDRYIGENINKILNIMDITVKDDIEGLLMSIDFEKAFDHLDWNYMFKVLTTMNFGETFKNYVITLYNDIESCIYNFGHRSDFFKLGRGLRQGCPLSPYLFILCVEILGISFRLNNTIKGIQIGNNTYKILQYADDTVLCLKWCECSLKNALILLKKFYRISGLKMNTEKTNVFRIGSIRNSCEKLCPHVKMKWENKAINVLGITVSYDYPLITKLNIESRLQKIDAIYKVWSKRNLSLYGKIIIIKTFGNSQLVYPFSNLPSPSDEFLKQIERCNFSFIWDSKPDKIKRDVLYKPYGEGGLKMVNIQLFNESLKLSWIKRLLSNKEGTWKYLVFYQFKIIDVLQELFFKCNLSETDFLLYYCEANVNRFWKNVLQTWCKRNCQSPLNYNKVCNQILWCNTFIRVQNRPVFYNDWYQCGCVYLKDLLNVEGDFMSFEQFVIKYHINCNILTYYGIISAIPKEWKHILRIQGDRSIVEEDSCVLYKMLSSTNITKTFYKHFVSLIPVEINTILTKWSSDLNMHITIDDFSSEFVKLSKATISTTLRSFKYRLLHRVLKTNSFAVLIGVADETSCTFCSQHDETFFHLFWSCTITQQFYQSVLDFISNTFHIDVTFEPKGILFSTQEDIVNLCFIIAQKYIYLCKTVRKIPTIEEYIARINSLENIEEQIAITNNKLQMHKIKWKQQ